MKLVYKDSQTSLTSFELSEYHHIIIDEAIVIYHSIVQLMEKQLHGMIGLSCLIINVNII